MTKTYRIEFTDLDLGQVIDGLSIRAGAWERTAEYHRTGISPPDFIIEECTDADEADRLATHYKSIITNILKQREAQS